MYPLVAVLGMTVFGQIFSSLINPEILLFGIKLYGDQAIAYQIMWSLFAIGISFIILRKVRLGVLLSTVFFLYNVLAIATSNFIWFKALILSPILVFGLVLSIAVLLSELTPNNRFNYGS
jgi:hypothetical protein